MGTTIEDFLHPEFVLFGVDEQNYAAALDVAEFYRTLHNAPFYETSIENAELIKVAYNTFISMKICFVNTLMEVCHKTPGCNVDEVTDAFQFATKRLLSMKYLRGGMGDGGGCHPRDNIAMSWLAREKGLSYDFFESIMKCREQQTDWLCHLVEVERVKNGYDKRVGIYGMSFKPETNLIVGSPARLLKTLFEERGYEVFQYDPHVHKQYSFEDKAYMPSDLKLFVVATQHDVYKTLNFPEGSVVIDPFRYMPDINGVKVIHVGRGNN
jgi:UDPglucose 6-dehydrogenase